MRAPSLSLLALLALVAAAAAQDYFVNCGSVNDHMRFVMVPGDTEARVTAKAPIVGARTQYLYQNHRTTRGSARSFTYVFPKRTPGEYMIELAFAEISIRPEVCRVGARRFNIAIQGRRVKTNFDIFAKVGCRRKTLERFYKQVVGSDGRLTFTFSAGDAGRPLISYIKASKTSATPAPPTTPTTCRGLGSIRRPALNDMSDAEWNNYVTAVTRMRQRDNGGISWFDWFARTHRISARHWVRAFLPWHRVMLFEWDVQLHAGVAGVRQPYFDWSRTPNSVFSNQAWRGSRLGGSFNGIPVNNPDRPWNTLTRNLNSSLTLESTAALNTIVSGMTTYDAFRLELEQAHGTFHNAVGGDMQTDSSPNDPAFYAHHAFIDKIWQDWIDRGSGRATVPGIGGSRMMPWGTTVNAIMGEMTRCVSYVRQNSALAAKRIQVGGDEKAVDDAARKAKADAREAAVARGAPADQLAELDVLNAELLQLMGVGNGTTTAPPTTSASAPEVTTVAEVPETAAVVEEVTPAVVAEVETTEAAAVEAVEAETVSNTTASIAATE